MSLEEKIRQLIATYVYQDKPAKQLSSIIIKKYKSRSRVFHDFDYLNRLWNKLENQADQLKNPESLKFALCFHKIAVSGFFINDIRRSKRTTKKMLTKISMSQVQIKEVTSLLEKAAEPWNHQKEENGDASFFMDLIRSPFGLEADAYSFYSDAIRREARFVPKGKFYKKRQSLLNNMSAMNSIFRLDESIEQFEKNARSNISDELQKIQS